MCDLPEPMLKRPLAPEVGDEMSVIVDGILDVEKVPPLLAIGELGPVSS